MPSYFLPPLRLWFLPAILLSFFCIPWQAHTTPTHQPKISVLPQQPLWLLQSRDAILHIDLRVQSTRQNQVTLRFAQLYASHEGQTQQIRVFSRPILLAYARRWDEGQRAWIKHSSPQIPPNQDIVLSLPPLRYPRNLRPDALSLRLYFQQGSRTLQRTLRISPQLPPSIHMRFPVRGRWWVANGNAPGAPHRHRLRSPSSTHLAPQRFALDFLRIDANNRIHRGAPHQNTSYLGFGERVFSPADGKILTIERRHQDAAPGRPDKQNPLGNYILIQHTPTLFSLLAHLKQGSIQVDQGQQVKAGHWLARVGNSGDGATPHLHYQLLQAPQPEESPSLPPLFWGLSAPHGAFSPFCPHDGQIVVAF
ncbi:MAG: M23 family metallopeptidase [Myxococcales bacterium]|nr:M23 family metallopeptidase [Myxococcales bacterium]